MSSVGKKRVNNLIGGKGSINFLEAVKRVKVNILLGWIKMVRGRERVKFHHVFSGRKRVNLFLN